MKKSLEAKSIKPYVVGFSTGVIMVFLLLLIAAFIMLKKDIGPSVVNIITTLICGGGSFIAAFVTAKKVGRNGIKIGALMGITIFVIISLVGVILGRTFSLLSVIRLCVILVAASVGGILGVNIKAKRKMM